MRKHKQTKRKKKERDYQERFKGVKRKMKIIKSNEGKKYSSMKTMKAKYKTEKEMKLRENLL